MSYKVKPRDVSPLLQKLRNFLLGREHTNALRFGEGMAPRTQPPPNLPEGPAHILSDNYYHLRDGRREVKPPAVLADSRRIDITAGGGEAISTGSAVTVGRYPPTPGKHWQWD
ncbi:NADH dehydrogenase [ubiquinone] 1 alpha subcomplex subunit 7-like [Zootermopsis nevadensis]|uniref:NADH dehydrogenase [ubiquinone] 1 alpha subcomplex subunit 7 n=1 Tax=Zootermopsis nevadensis TaxID=136037 RepID=A0A067QTT3_ZOONE|nr:NADH dehydrogenase [ubiquinone] 1 alpha subcomplex subunit 7-like [Zootermopsis nevadensis]KDR07358.1 NADH dehydrogenase [ubiquinone] 1 alpha subcomplex subunit 7 [Zootermopsis nevadensis]